MGIALCHGNSQNKKNKFKSQSPQYQNQQIQIQRQNSQNKQGKIFKDSKEVEVQKIEEGVVEIKEQVQVNENDQQQFDQNIDVDAQVGETLERINLNLIPRQQIVNLNQFTQTLPVIIELQTIKSQVQQAKANIDIVFVVDVSNSMEGEKIHLVKDSLRYIQKILKPNDRISIITFGTYSRINLPWTKNLPENKKKIKSAIVGMEIRDSTNIADGVELGLQMIKFRDDKNPVTCMFVLTDGQDDDKGADDRVAQRIVEYDIKDTFVINTFGYGDDHDAKVMNNIANLKGGSFTFIENVQKAAEHFIFAMSGMFSVLAKNVKLVVQENPSFKISKIFGDDFLWKQVEQGKYEMDLIYLQEHDNKEFALILELPTNEKVNLKQEVVLKAYLQGDLIKLRTEFFKQAELILNFSLQEIQFEPKEIVEVNYLRAKSGDVIGQAKELAKKKKYDQAQQLLNKMIDEIEESEFQKVRQLEIVLQDLKQVKNICKPQIFEQNGEALMLNKQRIHVQRQQCLDNSIEWYSDQEEQMEEFENGNLALSQCYYIDNSINSQEEAYPDQQSQVLRKKRQVAQQQSQEIIQSSQNSWDVQSDPQEEAIRYVVNNSCQKAEPNFEQSQVLRQNSSQFICSIYSI